jgi:peptide/nickel transport system substrate-binding protein
MHMTLRFFTDIDAVKAAIAAGTTDAAYGITPDGSRKALYEASYARIFAVFLNQNQNAIFADPAVRRALDTALDKNALVSTIVGGYGTPLSGPLPPLTGAREAASGGSITDARAILAADGWVLASSTATTSPVSTPVFIKKTKKTLTRLAFTLRTVNAPELKAAADMVADEWRALGADVKVEYFDQGDLATQVLRPRSYDAVLFGEVVGRDPDLYSFWDSSQRNDPGLNIALYTNSSVDKLLEAARAEADPAKRDADIASAAAIISKEEGAIFLYAPHLTYVAEPSLRGVVLAQVASPSDRFASVADWYLETERVWPLFAPH